MKSVALSLFDFPRIRFQCGKHMSTANLISAGLDPLRGVHGLKVEFLVEGLRTYGANL
jgi:hypothetical protein